MKTIHHVFDVSVTRSKVFAALNSTAGLGSWWSTVVQGDYRPGGLIHFTFVGDFNPDMEIVDLDQDNVVTWRCVSGHARWMAATFRFELVDHGAGTRVRFWQEYATELDDDSYGIYSYNWGYYLESLRLYLEEGLGKPFKP